MHHRKLRRCLIQLGKVRLHDETWKRPWAQTLNPDPKNAQCSGEVHSDHFSRSVTRLKSLASSTESLGIKFIQGWYDICQNLPHWVVSRQNRFWELMYPKKNQCYRHKCEIFYWNTCKVWPLSPKVKVYYEVNWIFNQKWKRVLLVWVFNRRLAYYFKVFWLVLTVGLSHLERPIWVRTL